MSKKILITGATGFIGSHLMGAFKMKGITCDAFAGDISKFSEVQSFLATTHYDCIYHLAGLSNVGACDKEPDRAFSINVTGTFNIVESLKKLGLKTRLIFMSTGQVYAPILEDQESAVIDESFEIRPNSVYSTTKLFSEKVIDHYFNQYDLGSAVILRLFNHTHISQKGPFFFPQMLIQIQEAAMDPNLKEIKVGNLEIYRDFGLVDDLIDLLVKIEVTDVKFKTDVFNVCSGQVRKLQTLAQELMSALNVEAEFVRDESRFRGSDAKFIKGSNLKCRSAFGWEPKTLTDKKFIEHFLSE